MREGVLDDARELRRGTIDPSALLERTVAALERWEPTLRSTVRILGDRAEAVARQRGDELRRGIDRGPLHGIPIAVKDLLDMGGEPTTAGSRILANNVAAQDAPAVAALEAAGAVIVAKTNTHEFAFGALTPPTRNPHDVARMPGGSSGGSAAIVGAGIVDIALGTDTAGSIREPAALCGVVGAKTTTGSLDLSGIVPLSWSLDTLGPLAGSPRDAQLLLSALAPIRRRATPVATVPENLPGTRLLVWAELLERMEAGVRRAFDASLTALQDAGAQVDVEPLGEPDESVAAAIVLLGAEALSYHRRWFKDRRDDYCPDVLGYLDLAATFTATDVVDAQRVRRDWRERIDSRLHGYDVLLAPAQLVVPPSVTAEHVVFDDGRDGPRDLTLIRPLAAMNLGGHPGISVPVGFSEPDGFPISIQLVGPHGSEYSLLGLASACQVATTYRRRWPTP